MGLIWLGVAVALVLLSHLPGLLQVFLAALIVGAGGATLWRFIFLQGSRALRAVEWPAEEGTYCVCVGGSGRRMPAIPEDCQQYGMVWLLRFQTAHGVAQLLVDTRYQDARALRRLGRRLFRDPGTERSVRAAGLQGTATIRPKV